jgi:polyisoprenoid-binding protein YceI
MVKKLLLVFVTPLVLFAGQLQLIDGSIKAHTSVFGEPNIDPMTKKINTNLTMENDIESINGEITINPMSLVSDNADRDANMYETLGAKDFTTISFKVLNISKSETGYIIGGVLNLHGVIKGIEAKGEISDMGNNIINLKSKFTIKMSDYGIEPPTMLFLTVRDEVDIDVNLKLQR